MPFRPFQREIITAALAGNDVFVQAATSFGKSLCFQLPAVIDRGSASGLITRPCLYANVVSHNCHIPFTQPHGTALTSINLSPVPRGRSAKKDDR